MSDDLLPSSASPQERALALTVARVSDVPPAVRDVWNPDTCPSALLPWLAWAFSVDAWDTGWSDLQKRDTIKSAVAVQKHKGTIGAVRDAIAALGLDCQVQEWFAQIPAGAPYTFNLLLNATQTGADLPTLQNLQGVVETYKNLRSHLGSVALSVSTDAGPTIAAVASVGSEIVLDNFVPGVIAANETTIILV